MGQPRARELCPLYERELTVTRRSESRGEQDLPTDLSPAATSNYFTTRWELAMRFHPHPILCRLLSLQVRSFHTIDRNRILLSNLQRRTKKLLLNLANRPLLRAKLCLGFGAPRALARFDSSSCCLSPNRSVDILNYLVVRVQCFKVDMRSNVTMCPRYIGVGHPELFKTIS